MKKVILNNLYMIRHIFRYIPAYVIYSIFLSIFNSIMYVMMYSYSYKYIIDSIMGGKSINEIIMFVAILIILAIIYRLLNSYMDHVIKPIATNKLNRKMQPDLFKKSTTIDIACFDDSKFYDSFIIATSNADTKVLEVFNSVMDLIQAVTKIVLLVSIMFTIDVLGVVLALVSFSLSIVVNNVINKIRHKKYNEQIPLERKLDYIFRVFYLKDYAKDIRMTDVKTKLINDYRKTNQMVKNVHRKNSKHLISLTLFQEFFVNIFIIYIFYTYVLAYKTLVTGTITIGSFSFLLLAIDNLIVSLSKLSESIGKLGNNSLYIEQFRNFINYESKIVSSEKAVCVADFPTIELKNLSFKYEDTYCLKDINMVIHPGEKIALVGRNGAGKTTLIKLLLRFYDPTEGEILIDGVNIKDIDINQYRNYFGCVFQDFQLYACTLAENVCMGNKDIEDRNIYDALYKSGLTKRLEHLHDGLNSQVTNELFENGTYLSGGEAQKLGIARTLVKPFKFVILDEPSSALDPVSEYEFNESVVKNMQNKSIVFISHRLSTTKMADRIYYLEHGEIIEAGKHDELMYLDANYARMFKMQAKHYQSQKIKKEVF